MKNYLCKQDFFFELPDEFIAQTPIKNRDKSKLMVLDRSNDIIEHKVFENIIDYLNPGDCLVLNDTRVIPARLIGVKQNSSTKIEFLLLKRLDKNFWEVLIKPARKLHIGDKINFGDLVAELIKINDDGNRIIKFFYDGIFEEILDKLGEMPLPPYIKTKLNDKKRYQTVYAKYDGSAAAPTAGLHFTNELLEKIKAKGIFIANLTLHVGLGTFRPVKVENVFEHKMHSEFFILNEENAQIINSAKKNGGRIIAVGTTSCRTLESCAESNGFLNAKSGWTDIFIYPGYKFKIVDALITNFHLPESTLIMLVSAFYGREKTLSAYEQAKKNDYKFFSFGDAMFIK